MKIECECGHLIVDQTDKLPFKAHLVPDQEWFRFLDAMDVLIDDVSAGKLRPQEASMAVRRAWPSRTAWQCSNCGRLYIDDRQHELNVYLPAAAKDSKEILRSRD